MSLNLSFFVRFALSDLKRSFIRFLFVVLAFAVGVGILVAVTGLAGSIRATIDGEARSLLAADISVSSSTPPTQELEGEIPASFSRAREVTFASMLVVSKERTRSRLVQVRALTGGYPFYGDVVVTPPDALGQLGRSSDERVAILDKVLAQQFRLTVGDSVALGSKTFTVIGIMEQFPGESYARTVIAPKIFVPFDTIQRSELLQRGSRVTYKEYLASNDAVAIESLLKRLKELQPKYRFEIETVESRRRNIARVLDNVGRFLALVSFSSMLLGAVGVASAMHTYMQQRLPVVASLRCIGATARQVLMLYALQGVIVSFVGATLGVLLGAAMKSVLPLVLGDFIPVTVAAGTPWSTTALGFGLGLTVGCLTAVWPLLGLGSVTPLDAVRGGEFTATQVAAGKRSLKSKLILGALAVAAFLGFASALFGGLRYGVIILVGLTTLVLALWGIAKLVTVILKRLRPESAPFAVRFGIASLYRPQNQTTALLLTLGLAAFLLSTIYLSQSSLLNQVVLSGSGTRPNLILFDVQRDQTEGVSKLLKQQGIAELQRVPIVTMRLQSINGVDNLALRSNPEIPEWVLRREYRSSYRDALIESEQLVEGEFVPQLKLAADDADPLATVIPVTVEEGIAKDLKVSIGDTVDFDVQSVLLRTKIVGVRRVDWRRVQTNFFFLFPSGVLEEAPQFFALMARATESQQVADLQEQLVTEYGNVSAIDLNLILETADQLLGKVATAVKFLAAFALVAGFLVLAGSIATSRGVRLRETLLLRTLGASRRQLVAACSLEYLVAAGVAAGLGVLTSVAAGWGIARFYFDAEFVVPFIATGTIFAGVVALVVVVGMIATASLLRVRPIQLLRG